MNRFLFVITALLFATHPAFSTTNINVLSFGAKGDGKTKDTLAFQAALDACAEAGGGTVKATNGVFLIGSIVLGTNTTLELEGKASLMGSPDIEDYPLIRVRWEGEFAQGHRSLIYAEKTAHVGISGRGIIYGPPISVSRLRNPRGPSLIEFSECEDVTLDGFTTLYQQLWSIRPVLCRRVTAREVSWLLSLRAFQQRLDQPVGRVLLRLERRLDSERLERGRCFRAD